MRALVARLLDHRDDLVDATPQLLVRDLHVEDVHRYVRALPDLDGLVYGLKNAFPLIPYVRGIDPAVLPGDFRELDEIVRRRQAGRRLEEGRRETHGAFLHRLRDELLHLVDLCGGRRRTARSL